MGLFKKKQPESPWSQVYRVSQGKYMPVIFKGNASFMLGTPSLWSPINPTPSFSLKLDEDEINKFGSNALQDFFQIFFQTYNEQFNHQEASEPPAWEEFSLENYPNYGMLTEAKEFRIEEQWIDDASSWRSEYVKNHSEKQFSLVLAMDATNIGQFYFPMFKDGQTEFVEFFHFKTDLTSDFGFAQWSICATDISIKTSVMGKVRFIKGATQPYEIEFRLPTNPVEYSMSLMQLGWKGEQ